MSTTRAMQPATRWVVKAAMALMLVGAGARADTPHDPLAQARGSYGDGDYARARDVISALIQTAELKPDQLQLARCYLAASYYYLKDSHAAHNQLEVMFKESPYARVDPVLFPPEIVQLGDDVLKQLADAAQRTAPAPGPTPSAPGSSAPGSTAPRPAPAQPAATDSPRRMANNPWPATNDTSVGKSEAPSATARRVPPLALAFIPFGVGQFANDQSGKGAAFLILQGLAVASFGTTAVLAESQKTGGTPFINYQVPPRKLGAFNTYETGYIISFWAGVGIYAIGVIDALISRPSAAVIAPGASPSAGAGAQVAPGGMQARW